MGELQNNDAIQLFEDKKIRTAWDEEQEEWYFSIVDVIAVLTGTENPRRYWSDLKRKLKKEGAVELYEKIVQLNMLSSDGKKYKTDVANTEQLLRIIPSMPSPKAEPFKAWLAMVGRKEIEETTGKPVITAQNANDFRQLVTDIVEDAAAIPEHTEEMPVDENKDE